MVDLERQISTLTEDQMLEAASIYLVRELDINDPRKVAAQVYQIVGGADDGISDFEQAVLEAGTSDTMEVIGLLELALLRAESHDPGSRHRLEGAIRSSGERQFVIGDDLLVLATLLLIGYVATVTQGKKEEIREIKCEEGKDGRIRVTYKKKTVYINPLSALGTLIKSYWPIENGKKGEE